MNAKQALARLRKVIGPKIAYKENKHGLDAAEREREKNIATELRIDANRLKVELDALREKLLLDTEYVYLRDRYNSVKQRADLAASASHRHKLSVGRMGELFFTVLVEGDNWEDVIEKAKEKGILR